MNRTRGFGRALWDAPSAQQAVRKVLLFAAPALVVGAVLAIVPFMYTLHSEDAAWLLILWFVWSIGAIGVLTRRSFSPPAFGLIAIMLVYLLIPASRAVLSGQTVIAGVDYTAGTLLALQISVVAQLGIIVGFVGVHHISGLARTSLRRVRIVVARRRLNGSAAITLTVAATAFALLTVTSGADISRYIAILGTASYGEYYSAALGTTSGYLSSLTGVAGVCILIAVIARSAPGQRSRPVLIFAIALLASGFLIANGQRVDFVVPLLAAGLLWIKIRRGRRPLAVRAVTVIVTCGLLMFSAVVGVARGPAGQPITFTTLIDAQFGEGSDLFAPLAGLAETVPSQQGYLNGASYIDAIYFPIPRAVWPAKPQGAILSVIASFSDPRNGESFPEFGEMYANFGLVGVIIGCMLFAGIMELMWMRFASSVDKRRLLLYPALIAIMLQVFTRAYAVSALAGVLGFLIGALVLQGVLRFDVSETAQKATQVTDAVA